MVEESTTSGVSTGDVLPATFIGPKKVKLMESIDRKTFIGKKDVVRIDYEDGSTEERPLEIVSQIITGDQGDMTKLREAMGRIVVNKILEIFLEAEVKVEDIDHFLTLTATSINMSLDGATEQLWGKKLYDRTMVDVQQVLKSIKK
jgi:hypothetical protein